MLGLDRTTAPARLFGVALALSLAVAGAAHAQSAQELYQQGMQALQAKRYSDAAKKLDASYRAQQVPLVLYNLGLAYQGMGELPKALEAFQSYVQYANPASEGDTIAAVKSEIARLTSSYGRFAVKLEPPNATIEIDGSKVEPKDGQLWVKTGSHKIAIRAQGYESYSQPLDVPAGKFDLDIKLRKPSGPPDQRATQLIDEGVALAAAGSTAAAIDKFTEAQTIFPTPRGAGELGLAQENAGELALAESNVGEALLSPRDPWVKENKTKLKRAERRIKSQLGTLQLSGEPAGAEVFVNKRPIGKLPIHAPVRVQAGNLTITATAEGYDPFELLLDLPPRGTRPVAVRMNRSPEPPPVVAPLPVPAAAPVATAPPAPGTVQPVAPPPEPQPAPPEPQPAQEQLQSAHPTQADIEAVSNPQDDMPGEEPEEDLPPATGFEMALNFGYMFWVSDASQPMRYDKPASSSGAIGFQLGLGYRIVWPLSIGFQLNLAGDFGADGTKGIGNAFPGLYVHAHSQEHKTEMSVDVWGGVGLQPVAFQIIANEAQPIDPTMVDPNSVDPATLMDALLTSQTGVDDVLTIQSVNIPIDLGVTLYVSEGLGIDLAMALTFWLPTQACLHQSSDRLCADEAPDSQISYFIGAGLNFLP